MSTRHYHGRRAASIENDHVRVTVLEEGGHIAEVLDKRSGITPLWTPRWTSLEPSVFDPGVHGATYGAGTDGKLLAGIVGHNLCLDIFGRPSDDEAAAGVTRENVRDANLSMAARQRQPRSQLSNRAADNRQDS